jgi:tetratricopeptide (TPR) repeat protein
MNSSEKPWQSLLLPAAVTRIKSMLSHEEKQYLTWLTSEKFEGWGAVLDLGPWMGSSSAALAEGIRRQGNKCKVFSFDLFSWEPSYMESIAPENLKEGDDFIHLFLREIADYEPFIQAQKQDLKKYVWDDGPIEILFVDAAKSWELTNSILKGFGHQLVPGKSRIVLQDFRHYSTHWLPAIFDSRPDIWKEMESIENGWTVSFMPLKNLSGPAGIDLDYSEDAFPMIPYELLIKARMARETPSNKHQLLRSLYRKCLVDGSFEEALGLREELVSGGDQELALIEDVESLLIPKGWAAYNRQEYLVSKQVAEKCVRVTKKRSADVLLLMGFSLLRLGDREAAGACIEEVLQRLPDSSSARLFRAELALGNGFYDEAETEILEVLANILEDEALIAYCLNLLAQVWDIKRPVEFQLKILSEHLKSYPDNSFFLGHLSRLQFKLGFTAEAELNLKRSLEISPNNPIAVQIRSEQESAGEVCSIPSPDLSLSAASVSPAGRLHKPVIPNRPLAHQGMPIEELSSELLARVQDGSFGANDRTILLGLEILENLRVSLDIHGNRSSAQHYRDMFGTFYEYVEPIRPMLTGSTIVEIGCGSINPYGYLFLCLMLGAKCGIAVDLDDIQNVPRSLRALADLAGMILVDPENLINNYQITREQVLRNIASFDLHKLRAGDSRGLDSRRLQYLRESANALSMPAGAADTVISNAFFEHLPHPNEVIKELARITSAGGVGIHVVDSSDHLRYGDPRLHPLEFLTENTDEPLVHGSNRLRPFEFVKLFEQNGFEVMSLSPIQCSEIPSDLRDRFVEPFRSMDEKSLSITCAKIVVRRL